MRSIAHGFGDKMALHPNLFDIKVWGEEEEEEKVECRDSGLGFKIA